MAMKTLTTLPPVETPALVVREMVLSDGPSFARFMTDPRYQRHIAVRLSGADEVRAFVNRTVARQGDSRRQVYHLAAALKIGGEVVGDGFLIRGRDERVEIGWGVARVWWGKGIGTEIGRALVGLAFERLGARETWCKVMAANLASQKLARRIGLAHTRSSADFPAGAGRFEAVEIYALAAERYYELPY